MQVLKKENVVQHKTMQSNHKIRTHCYKQVANNGASFGMSSSQNQGVRRVQKYPKKLFSRKSCKCRKKVLTLQAISGFRHHE